jgi:hypothetical protein
MFGVRHEFLLSGTGPAFRPERGIPAVSSFDGANAMNSAHRRIGSRGGINAAFRAAASASPTVISIFQIQDENPLKVSRKN